jgi:hypothetical protein
VILVVFLLLLCRALKIDELNMVPDISRTEVEIQYAGITKIVTDKIELNTGFTARIILRISYVKA